MLPLFVYCIERRACFPNFACHNKTWHTNNRSKCDPKMGSVTEEHGDLSLLAFAVSLRWDKRRLSRTAMTTQHMLMYGDNLSPILAAFQKIPKNLLRYDR